MDEMPGINTELLREHFTKQILREESERVKEPTHELSTAGKLQIRREKGTLERVQPKAISRGQARKRVPSGILGLDEAMQGGFIKNSSVLIGGGAGTGKSILCMQYLVEGIKRFNEPGVFISFEQQEQQILEDFAEFPWDLRRYIEDKKLVILSYAPEQVEKVLQAGGGTVRDTIDSIGAKRLVVDSLTAYTLLHENDLQKRKAVFKLFDAAAKWGVTALMTTEQEADPDKHQSTVIEFEVGTVVLLYNIRKGDIRERSLEIFKMRATKHAAKIFPMTISDEGIKIFPDEAVF